jgi:hypothetical protein
MDESWRFDKLDKGSKLYKLLRVKIVNKSVYQVISQFEFLTEKTEDKGGNRVKRPRIIEMYE